MTTPLDPALPSLDEAVATSVLVLLRVVAGSGGDGGVSMDDIVLATRSAPDRVLEVIDLLESADLLTKFRAPSPIYAISLGHLSSLFGGDGWRGDYQGMRLSEAYSGNGEYTLYGWDGQDNHLLRYGYVETKRLSSHDSQVSRITAKGRAVYHVLRLMYPDRGEPTKAA